MKFVLVFVADLIGVGANRFDADDFDVDFAYMLVDLREQYEDQHAAELQGRNVHPGAKGQMLIFIINFLNSRPERRMVAGFYHLMDVPGSVENAASFAILKKNLLKLVRKPCGTC